MLFFCIAELPRSKIKVFQSVSIFWYDLLLHSHFLKFHNLFTIIHGAEIVKICKDLNAAPCLAHGYVNEWLRFLA